MSLNNTARSAIVKAVVTSFTTHDNTGNLVTQMCEVAAKYSPKDGLTKEDINEIAESVGSERGWKDKVLASRTSEIRVVLRACKALPETIKLMQSKAGRCDWHTGVKLGRHLNKGATPKDSVAALLETSSNEKKISPAGKAAGALSYWYKHAKADKRDAIVKAAKLLGLELRGLE